jgi:hypothetical protein
MRPFVLALEPTSPLPGVPIEDDLFLRSSQAGQVTNLLDVRFVGRFAQRQLEGWHNSAQGRLLDAETA